MPDAKGFGTGDRLGAMIPAARLTRPLLVLYILWHPEFAKGAEIAESLREHFRRKLYGRP
jgi:hypothetical protein